MRDAPNVPWKFLWNGPRKGSRSSRLHCLVSSCRHWLKLPSSPVTGRVCGNKGWPTTGQLRKTCIAAWRYSKTETLSLSNEVELLAHGIRSGAQLSLVGDSGGWSVDSKVSCKSTLRVCVRQPWGRVKQFPRGWRCNLDSGVCLFAFRRSYYRGMQDVVGADMYDTGTRRVGGH